MGCLCITCETNPCEYQKAYICNVTNTSTLKLEEEYSILKGLPRVKKNLQNPSEIKKNTFQSHHVHFSLKNRINLTEK